jgi:hypothetical protein
MGIRDLLEMAERLNREQLVLFGRRLSDLSFSLATLQCEFRGKRIDAILKRGRIRNEEEYYLLKGLSEDVDPPPDLAAAAVAARRLVEKFELALPK